MSHRRSSSLSGGVSELKLTPPPKLPQPPVQGRRASPRKESSVDTGEEGDDISGRRSAGDKRNKYASVAFESIGNKSEELIHRFDEKFDYIESGPIAQSVKAKAHRAGEVIEEHVLKHVKLPNEVYEVLHEIEKTQAYQSARGRVQKAYSYVEPILSRVASTEVDDDPVNFVIPHHLQNSPSGSPKFTRPYNRSFDLDPQSGQLDISQYHRQRESVPEIKISDETGRSSIVSPLTGSLLNEKALDAQSIISTADSEKHYEIIRPNKLYRTPPSPKPVPRKRRSLLVKYSSAETRTSIAEEQDENQKLIKSPTVKDCECANNECEKVLSVVKFQKNSPQGGTNVNDGNKKTRKLQRQDTVVDTEKFLRFQGSKEDDPLLPKKAKIKGIPEVELKEHLKDILQNVVVINGKTYIIPQRSAQEIAVRERYGGASEFFEESISFEWETVPDVVGKDPNQEPRWLQRIFNGIEGFLSNAHDPWLSEADKDPLACENCGCLDGIFGGGPRRPGIDPGGNCITRHINNETFCVVSKRFRKNYVHRFSASKSLFLFSPWNPLRRAAIYLSTNQFFDYIVMGTILLNCIFLAMTKPVNEAEYMFLAIYTTEMVIKTVAKGFILNKYTYLRNPWNWLDFVVIASGYVTLVIELGKFNVELGNLAGLRTFRVLRALKTVSIMPGLKTIINALLNSIKQLVEVMTLTVFCLMVFALFALQVYMGVLKNKCVREMLPGNYTDEQWSIWVQNKSHWWVENGTDHPNLGDPVLCGNASGARVCPAGYSCLDDIGDNPNFGYTSFDNFLWSMLTTFQLITLDFWEDVYNKVIATGGPLQVVFFAIVVFFGSFYLINLMLAVVAMSYEEESENTEEEKTKDLTEHRDDSTFSFDPEKLTHAKPLEKKSKRSAGRVIVMRKGAAILSDSFAKKKKNKQKDSNSPTEGVTSASSRNSPPASATPQRPASLVVSPPSVTAPSPEREQGVPKVGGNQNKLSGSARNNSSTCEPCTGNSNRCCQCQCHARGQESLRPLSGAPQKGCEDQRPYLRLANNPSNKQPSLDDSGVVGDHEGGDTISLNPQIAQEKVVSKGDLSLYIRRKCNGVSPSSPAGLSASSQHIVVIEDDLVDRNCEKCRDCCMNYHSWLRFQKVLYVIVHAASFDLFIMFCIILNTIFLAVEHHGMSYTLDKVLEIGNRVFTAVFTLECMMKIMALSREFFVNKWNVFDLVIVLASLLDLGLEIGSGLSVLRGMRLLRVLKLAQSWRTMRVLLSIIISTLGALGNLTFVLLIVIYIFAVIGMQLFGKNYNPESFKPDPVPRWNFTDFFHSFMMIFRILCGEWVEPLWDCMRAAGNDGAETCLAIFLPALVMGNFMVLNLFLAMLLNSFNSDELKSRNDDLDDESRVLDLLVRIKNKFIPKRFQKKKKEKEEEDEGDNLECSENQLAIEDVPDDIDVEAGCDTHKKMNCELHLQQQIVQKQPLARQQLQVKLPPQKQLVTTQPQSHKEHSKPSYSNQSHQRENNHSPDEQLSSRERYNNDRHRNCEYHECDYHKSNHESSSQYHQQRHCRDNQKDQSDCRHYDNHHNSQPDRGVKQAFSEPEILHQCHDEEDYEYRRNNGIDPQKRGYNRMAIVAYKNQTKSLERPKRFMRSNAELPHPFITRKLPTCQSASNLERNSLTPKRKFVGFQDDDRPEAIELSVFNQRHPPYHHEMQRRNSDPTLESPNEFRQHRPVMRNYSNEPCAPTPNPDDPYFPTVHSTAITPEPQLYREHYNPSYNRQFYDYRSNYNSDYRDDYVPSNYLQRHDSYRSNPRDDYVHKPLDYRDDYKSNYSPRRYNNYSENYRSDYSHRISDYNYKADYSSRFNDCSTDYRTDYDHRRIDYHDDYRQDYYLRNTSIRNDFSNYRNDSYTNVDFRKDYRNSNYPKEDYRNETYERNPRFRGNYDTEYSGPRKLPYSNDYNDYHKDNYDYRDDYTQDYSQRSYDYPKRRYHGMNTSEVSERDRYNDDSISEIQYSDKYDKKRPQSETNYEEEEDLQGSGDDLPEICFDPPEEEEKPNVIKEKQVRVQERFIEKKMASTPNWGTVLDYVDEITAGVKDDDDPRFQKAAKKQKEPWDCFPKMMYNKCVCCQKCTNTIFYKKWFQARKACLIVVDSPYFEWFILLMIFASSITLCFEDIHLDSNPELKERRKILTILNMSFAILFTVEMFLKWISFGFVKYFTSVWTILDCFIVMVSVSSLFVKQDNLIALRSLRTLRALRPLRAISRWQGMKIVVNALMYAIPSIFNVLLVCLVFWLIFSIMGVQMFGGKFYKCIDNRTGIILSSEVVNNKSDCLLKPNSTWVNSKINFDHVGYAYLALFQVATFEGWMEVMNDAVDCRGIDLQPEREANIYAYIYFVIFIVCGSFFTLNLFIGVIIDNFNMLKKKMYEGGVLEMFLTDSQKNYYTAMKKLGRKKPQKVIRRPQHHYHAIFYDIAVSRRFEISIFVLIFLNMVTMAIEHHHQSRTVAFTLEVFNALFTTIFGLEAIVKIIGLRHHYFTVPWNLFDFILVFASIMGILLQDLLTNFPISPTLLRVVRVFRIGRILRLIKAAKGIRKLLFALIVSLPALFNIGALLFLITFIYAIIGMAVFGHVQRNGALDDLVNFETFGSSMMLLFRLITSAGWNDVLDPLMAQPPDCDPFYQDQPNGNCGHPVIAIAFFVSFIIINFMIVINMYIAVILENFNQAHKEEEIGIVEDDLEMFYVRWSKYDPHATQFINFNQLSDFIASLDAPFGIAKPNTVALVSFDLPIANGDKIHCLDILHALTKHVLGHVEETEEFRRFPPQLKMQMEEKFKKQFPTRKELEIVSSTRRWKKMDTAAKIIQRAWKGFTRKKREAERKNLLLEEAQTQTSSPGGSSIKSGFRKVSHLLQVVPMPMSLPRRRSVTVLQEDKAITKNRRGSDKSPSPRSSFFFPLSRRASRASATSLVSNCSQVSVQIHKSLDPNLKNSKEKLHKGDAS